MIGLAKETEMSTPAQAHSSIPLTQTSGEATQASPWRLSTRIAFRFCFAYFSLYSLLTQIAGGLVPIAAVELPDLGWFWPTRQVVFWTAAHVFHVKTEMVTAGSGSGDKTFDWVLAFCLLIASTIATAIWSALDRERENYITLHKWFRVFVRFALGSEMLIYGLMKLVPVQMPFPRLVQLVEPFGSFSPMGVLWSSVGASPRYEMFAGSAEVLAGVLLIVPRTSILGALVCLADTAQVFALNMIYDVPVKLFSFHLILMSAYLLAPELPRLVNFFLLNRTAEPSGQPPLFRTARANRIALVVQLVFGLWLAVNYFYVAHTSWYSYGDGAPKPSLYGIWDVDQLSIDGQVRAPLLNDYNRWRRVIFDLNGRLLFQRMDDSLLRYSAQINDKEQMITATGNNHAKTSLTFHRMSPAELTLDGTMDGHKLHLQLRLEDRNHFLLVNHGFHWVQEYPFNR